jgi:hypoxanthine-DNA glycosylase
MQITSFAPLIDTGARVLILGSMPGVRSLTAGEYYAHPRNRFWPVMSELCGASFDLPYPDRIHRLKQAGVALWDVLKHCHRDGSLDARIEPGSEVVNDLSTLLIKHAEIQAIAFNGQKAARSFDRLMRPVLSPDHCARITLYSLPSTSPANAAYRFSHLVAEWRVLAPHLRT